LNRNVVDAFFDEYVYGFMFKDIQREIAMARTGSGGGNFLAALGLLCYTEYLGGVKRDKFTRGQSRGSFNAFFPTLGPCYDALNRDIDVYDVFRNGMAHEYFVKKNCVIAMLKGDEECGLGRFAQGGFYFVVEKYFEDFANACYGLHKEMLQRPPSSVLQVVSLGVPHPGGSGPSIRFIDPRNPTRLDLR